MNHCAPGAPKNCQMLRTSRCSAGPSQYSVDKAMSACKCPPRWALPVLLGRIVHVNVLPQRNGVPHACLLNRAFPRQRHVSSADTGVGIHMLAVVCHCFV